MRLVRGLVVTGDNITECGEWWNSMDVVRVWHGGCGKGVKGVVKVWCGEGCDMVGVVKVWCGGYGMVGVMKDVVKACHGGCGMVGVIKGVAWRVW